MEPATSATATAEAPETSKQAVSGIIAVDVMGGDKGPEEILAGIELALKNDPSLSGIVAVGDQAIIETWLKSRGLTDSGKVKVFPTSQVIDMDEKPVMALKKKRDSSMMRAIEMVKDGDAKAVLSCGNTGALMAGGTLKLRPQKGIERPALATAIPCRGGHFVLVDAGANPDSRPEHLVHNAILGSYYAEIGLGVRKPRVGLLTIGTEEGKGNERTAQTHDLLKHLNGIINYQGLIEGFQTFEGEVDVVVCDGFVGNILLKSSEALYKFLIDTIKDEVKANPVHIAGAALMKGAFSNVKKKLSPDQYGGAPLLGLKGNVLKAHGSSNRYAIASAIRIGIEIAQQDMVGATHDAITKANKILEL
ncbi:MAG: phosphate acyltransferase PlsX [Opitutales bacterium]